MVIEGNITNIENQSVENEEWSEPEQQNLSKEDEDIIVPPQGGLSGIVSAWDALIEEWVQFQPLVSGPFTHCEINLKPENQLQILFKNAAHYSLVEKQNKYLIQLKQFLKNKLATPVPFSVDCRMHENPDLAKVNSVPETSTSKIQTIGEDELVEAEPIIGYIIEKFDGRVL